MVPDFRIFLTIAGETRQVLHALKVISSNQSRYKTSWEERGVDKRAQCHSLLGRLDGLGSGAVG